MRRGQVNDERADDLDRMGVDAATARAWLAASDEGDPAELQDDEPADEPLHVWPENWPVLRLWMRLQTQWHRRPDGGMDGLRRDAADIQLRRARLSNEDEVWEHLLQMEHAAMEAQDG